MDRVALLRKAELFVLDMDGTFYLGGRLLPGALDFVARARAAGRRVLFFTNNSSRAAEDYIQKLAGMGCPIERRDILTSGDVAIHYLKTHHPGAPVYLMGTNALRRSFKAAGIPLAGQDAAVVVAAFDTELSYEKLERACTLVRQGAHFLATHPDINCPTETGFIPDCGALCAAMALSTGRQPKYLGKPHAETVELVLAHTGAQRGAVAFVGDRLYTDVAAGVQNGAMGFLVLTGETTRADLNGAQVRPHAVFESLGEMAALL